MALLPIITSIRVMSDPYAVERGTDRSGVRIRYLDNAADAPRGLPISFSPGLSGRAVEYLEMLRFFHLRRVLVVEVRRRERNGAPPSGYTVSDHFPLERQKGSLMLTTRAARQE
jgi:hypothetical protein